MNRTHVLIGLLGLLSVAGRVSGQERLIVFVQPDASELAQRFTSEHEPAIAALAGDMGLEYSVVDVSAGAPEQVCITPLIMFQNHRGRSVYQGRYTTPARIRNFIRTARVLPKLDEKLTLRDIHVWDMGQAKVAAPIKVTDLTGRRLDGSDQDAFKAEVIGQMAQGFERFKPVTTAELRRTDRQFYMDVYPYRSAEDQLFVTVALYSQFHCHEPVYTNQGSPISGPWSQRGSVFAQAAALLEKQVVLQIAGSTLGDGFDLVPSETPTRTYEQLGLSLPDAPPGVDQSRVDIDVELPERWRVDQLAAAGEAMIQFAFAAPLDLYSGEFAELDGCLAFGDGASLSQASGRFVVQVASITMGEDALDAELRDTLLKTDEHPQSQFVFDRLETPHEALKFGRVTPAALVGTFTLMGTSIELTAPTSLEPFIGDDGQPRLSLQATWSLQIGETWGLEGPPGPPQASDTMRFIANIVLEADSPQKDTDR